MMRRKLVKLITFLAGLYFFLEFILPEEVAGYKFSKWHEQITFSFQVVGSSAFALGLISILRHHGLEVLLLRKKWLYSSALLIGMFAMLFITALDWYESEKVSSKVKKIAIVSEFSQRIKSDYLAKKTDVPAIELRNTKLIEYAQKQISELSTDAEFQKTQQELLADSKQKIENFITTQSTFNEASYDQLSTGFKQLASAYSIILQAAYEQSNTKSVYRILFDGLFTALGAAMFSLLGFYIASAAYRAFRIYSLEASLMMIAALFVMLGQISFGPMIWEELPAIRHWLLTVPNTAAFRAIEIGTAIAAIVISFRMWLSIESEGFTKNK